MFLAAAGVTLWHSLDSSSANTLRVAVRTQPRAGSGGQVASAPPATAGTGDTAPTQQSAPTTTVVASTVCAHPVRVDGPVVDTQFGPVQVRAELGTGNHVCSADAIQSPSDRERSVLINQQAVPWINDEVKTQGVNFDAIGGATYTSEGYRESLQSILDARAK